MGRVSREIVNLGILAHVDAGKTSLTERLLYCAGVIDEPGRVDDGTTQTDRLALERQRGITIKSAVVSFTAGGRTVNLIDTPGHPDFVAEVERALSVLDRVVLVFSAVEGVQPQTRILWRALQRLRVPTLFYINKIDRRGASDQRVLADIAQRLTPAIVPMGTVSGLGTRGARFLPATATDDLAVRLAEHDDAVLTAYLAGPAGIPGDWLREKLAGQVKDMLIHPVYCGSAMTGAGVDALLRALPELLPAADGDPDGPVAGRVFKIERGPGGEKIAFARLFSGTVAVRDRVRFGRHGSGKVTAVSVFADGGAERRDQVTAGQIATLSGLPGIRVGDGMGTAPGRADQHYFTPPTLETAVVASDPRDKTRLHAALTELAEQDPLINVRQDDRRQEIYLSLYGEVQNRSSTPRWLESTGCGPASGEPRRSASNGRSAPARPRRSCTPQGTRSWPRWASASNRHRRVRVPSSGWPSATRRCRCTSTKTWRTSQRPWNSTSAGPCGRACPAGRSSTVW
jgi:ribosomal protection tetracycline resistance protein